MVRRHLCIDSLCAREAEPLEVGESQNLSGEDEAISRRSLARVSERIELRHVSDLSPVSPPMDGNNHEQTSFSSSTGCGGRTGPAMRGIPMHRRSATRLLPPAMSILVLRMQAATLSAKGVPLVWGVTLLFRSDLPRALLLEGRRVGGRRVGKAEGESRDGDGCREGWHGCAIPAPTG